MNRRDQDELLREVLAGDELAELRRASLEGGLAALRGRRRAAPAAVVAGLALLVGAEVWVREQLAMPEGAQVASNPPAVSSQGAPAVKSISDEELLALFPDRSVMLIGPPGHQVFLVLDEAAKDDDPQL